MPRFLSRLPLALLVVSLIAIGLFFQFKDTQAAAPVAKNRLAISVTRLNPEGEPQGFLIQADGWIHMQFFVPEDPSPLPPIGIHEVNGQKIIGKANYYHAGVYDQFIVKRQGSTVQIIRQSADEMTPTQFTDRHVVFSGYLPSYVKMDQITQN